MPLVDGGTIRLTRMIGHSHALDMILRGKMISGPEAHRLGLVQEVWPNDELQERAQALAHELAASGGGTIRIFSDLLLHDVAPEGFRGVPSGDASGASSHKFSSGSHAEGRISGKAAIRYLVNEKPEAPSVSDDEIAKLARTMYPQLQDSVPKEDLV